MNVLDLELQDTLLLGVQEKELQDSWVQDEQETGHLDQNLDGREKVRLDILDLLDGLDWGLRCRLDWVH